MIITSWLICPKDLTLSTTNYLYGANIYDSFSRHVFVTKAWRVSEGAGRGSRAKLSNYLFCRLLRLFGLQGIVLVALIGLFLWQYRTWTENSDGCLYLPRYGFSTFSYARWGRNDTSKICQKQNYCVYAGKSLVALIINQILHRHRFTIETSNLPLFGPRWDRPYPIPVKTAPNYGLCTLVRQSGAIKPTSHNYD